MSGPIKSAHNPFFNASDIDVEVDRKSPLRVTAARILIAEVGSKGIEFAHNARCESWHYVHQSPYISLEQFRAYVAVQREVAKG